MKFLFRTIVLLFSLFLTGNMLLKAENPIIKGGEGPDTLLISLDCDIADFANPFLLKSKTGDKVFFKAINGEFSILIRNADKFFEDVGQTVKIHLNDGEVSELYTVKFDLPIDSEIKYEVYCITQNRWADAPPRIIIVPQDEY